MKFQRWRILPGGLNPPIFLQIVSFGSRQRIVRKNDDWVRVDETRWVHRLVSLGRRGVEGKRGEKTHSRMRSRDPRSVSEGIDHFALEGQARSEFPLIGSR